MRLAGASDDRSKVRQGLFESFARSSDTSSCCQLDQAEGSLARMLDVARMVSIADISKQQDLYIHCAYSSRLQLLRAMIAGS